jgi:hypothetical protein
MSDIRFNRWLHNSGTGGVFQDSAGNVGIGSSVPQTTLDLGSGNIKVNNLNSTGIITATGFSGNVTGTVNSTGIITATGFSGNVTGTVNSTGIITATSFSGSGSGLTGIVNSGITTVAAGSTAYPSISPAGDIDTGIFFPSANTIAFGEGGAEAARFDSDGRLLVGTSSALSNTYIGNVAINPAVQIEGASSGTASLSITRLGGNPFLILQRGSTGSPVISDDIVGQINFSGFDGANYRNTARITSQVDGTPSYDAGDMPAGDMPGALVFSTTPSGSATPTERMRITSSGAASFGTTGHQAGASSGDGGHYIGSPGSFAAFTRSSGTCVFVNRISNDGKLIEFRQNGNDEGNINVSGASVTLTGAHLTRYSQLPEGAVRTEILRGSVLSNLDEMCEWGEEDNEQLNRMQVSDVEGDKNVSGVFQSWDDDDDIYVNDFYCAMTGDFVIRIAQGTTVARGDLLMSAGDGTAKPQADDLVRSCTVAKVTSTTVSCTHPDGSYCVPCVLMAC